MATVTRTSPSSTLSTPRSGVSQPMAAEYAAFEQAAYSGGGKREPDRKKEKSAKPREETEEVVIGSAIPPTPEIPFSYAQVAMQLRAVYERHAPSSSLQGVFIPFIGEVPIDVADAPVTETAPRNAMKAYQQAQEKEKHALLIDL